MSKSHSLPSILIVDDEEPARAELTRLIKQINIEYPLHEAANSSDALTRLNQFECDIVFLDIQLYDQNGLYLAEKMLKRTSPPLIIMATAHDEYALQGFELNVIDFILKPFRSQRVAFSNTK